jgi:hypothetical protein
MEVSFGLKAHSGWAMLVVMGTSNGEFKVVDRRRLELVDEQWAKQPYHAAEKLEISAARKLVASGIASARRIATREIRSAVKREREKGNKVAACAVLVSDPMPEWTVEQILAVHFRMHKAEGVLFREVLVRAAEQCALKAVRIPEKLLPEYAESALRLTENGQEELIASLGKDAGTPWGKDQKVAALAALIALGETKKPGRASATARQIAS